MPRKHTRIVQYPFAASLQGALLDSYEENRRGKQPDITLNIRAMELTALPELFDHNGIIHERVRCTYIPAQIHFSKVSELKSNNVLKILTNLSRDDPARTIEDMLSWRQPERSDVFYLIGMHAPQAESLMFFAHRATYERLSRPSIPITLEREWCPPPLMPGQLVPKPQQLHSHFGGDPVTLYIDGRQYKRRLFIGGLEIQPNERPQVDVVLNLGEQSSTWIRDVPSLSQDRWDNKGEGSEGMSIDVIREEAAWVIERLNQNQRVLVHCVAGMNRSSTICCAVLILLEGLTAEQALARVREHHPWARPDSSHWLKLRWLAKTNLQQT
jgi:Dual specificity phosphatase, catalytic domain